MIIDLDFPAIDMYSRYATPKTGPGDSAKDYNRALSLFSNYNFYRDAKNEGFNQAKKMVAKSTGKINEDKMVRRAKAFLLYAYERGHSDSKGNLQNVGWGKYEIVNNQNDPFCFANEMMLGAFRGIIEGAKSVGADFTQTTIDNINRWAQQQSGVNILIANLKKASQPQTLGDKIREKVKTTPIEIFKD